MLAIGIEVVSEFGIQLQLEREVAHEIEWVSLHPRPHPVP